MATTKHVEPYPDAPMTRERLALETYEYKMPFNYANITVSRRYFKGMEFHGVEMNPVNSIAVNSEEHLPPDTIEIVEQDPIVRVVVMGSACVPPGFVQLEADPLAELYKDVDVPGVAAVRYRIGNLWGMHMRVDAWMSTSREDVVDFHGRQYDAMPEARQRLKPGLRGKKLKGHYRENPLVGMSCAVFEIPKSRKVAISGGSEVCAWSDDNFPDDVHYSFRIIRVTVARVSP